MFKKALIAAMVTSAAVSTANAADVNGYLFASAGKADHDLASLEKSINAGFGAPGVSSSADERDTAFKIGAGVQLNRYVGIELQYVDLGEGSIELTDGISTLKAPLETDGLGANLVGTLPLDRFQLFGKLGYHQLETEVKIKFDGQTLDSASEKEWVTSYGLGAAFAFTETLSLVGEYERYTDVADEFDVDLATIGLRYNF